MSARPPLLTAITPAAGLRDPGPAIAALARAAGDHRHRLAVMLRSPALDVAGWQVLLSVLAPLVQSAGLQLAVNVGPRRTPAQVLEFARALAPWPVHGLQLPEGAGGPQLWRETLIGLDQRVPAMCCSRHGRGGLMSAFAAGADRVLISPAWPTASKPSAPALGLAGLRALAAAAPGPLLALGGIAASNVVGTLETGVAGVACLSAAWGPQAGSLVDAALSHNATA